MNVEDTGRAGGSRARIRARWVAHVLAQASSGLTAVDYCREHGLRPKSFYRWKRALRDSGELGQLQDAGGPDRGGPAGRDAKALFAEVRMPEGVMVPAASGVEVALRSGAVVRVARGFDAGTLRRVVSALEEGAC